MTAQQDWEEYARLVTRVGTAGAGERRRQDDRRRQRTREREESEDLIKEFAEWREDLDQRTRNLQAYADDLLKQARVSPAGETEQITLSYTTSVELADAMDGVGEEMYQVAQQLSQARQDQSRQRSRWFTAAVFVLLPLVTAGVAFFAAGGNEVEALVAAVLVLALAGFTLWSRRSAAASLIAGVVIGAVVCGVIAALGQILTVLCLGLLAVILISAFVQALKDHYGKGQ